MVLERRSSVSHSVVSDSLQPHELLPARLFFPWDSPGKNTRVVCHSLLQRIFLTQGSKPGLLYCRQILYRLSYREDLLEGKKSPTGVNNSQFPLLFHTHTHQTPICLRSYWVCKTASLCPLLINILCGQSRQN